MLNIRQVKEILGLSYENIIAFVKDGTLPAHFYYGPVDRAKVERTTTGLRFKESDIDAFLERTLVK